MGKLVIADCWPVAVRFRFAFLIDHPNVRGTCAVITVLVGLEAVTREWRKTGMRFSQSSRIRVAPSIRRNRSANEVNRSEARRILCGTG